MAKAQDDPVDDASTEGAGVQRRVVLRGAVAVGLLGAAGLPLTACGNDSPSAAGAAADAITPTPTPARTIRPGVAQPTSKSDLYPRSPEPRRPRSTPAPAAAAEATPEPAPATGAGTEPAPASRSNEGLATARRRDGQASGRPSPSPAPLPPGAFARTADIPVGGGRTYKDQKIVVTQPTAGQYRGFNATCTHAGCLVDKVEDGEIVCPCHGSRFSISDGKVDKGPALLPLRAEPIVVSPDGAISRG